MKNKKTLVILLIVMVLIVVLVPTLALADDFTGSITIQSNNVPTIDTFTVDGITAMTPTGTCNVTLTVTDLDDFTNIDDITLVFWHSTVTGDPTDLPAYDEGTNDSAVLNWINVWDGSVFTADTTNTTWASTAPALSPTGTTHTFTFAVTVGKEAMEVAPAADADKWLIAVKVTDANANTAFMLSNDSTALQISTDWYGEMIADVDAGPIWNMASPGMIYTDEPAQVFDATYTLAVISNGDFSLEATAGTDWDDGTNHILYDTAIDAANEFSIAVDSQSTYNVVTAVELINDGDANLVTEPVTLNTPGDLSWGGATAFDGVSISNIYMFLQTNASMTTSAIPYTGNVTFTIVNN